MDAHHLNVSKKYDYERLQEMAKEYGFELTAEQRRKVKPKKVSKA